MLNQLIVNMLFDRRFVVCTYLHSHDVVFVENDNFITQLYECHYRTKKLKEFSDVRLPLRKVIF
jgi:hypothetical protein